MLAVKHAPVTPTFHNNKKKYMSHMIKKVIHCPVASYYAMRNAKKEKEEQHLIIKKRESK